MEIFRIPVLTSVHLDMDTAWLDGGDECDPVSIVDDPIPSGI